jgi:diadenosine tetraphosphatase ApaH/serine/threonine PP2A family protein phosphatase
MKDPFRVAVLVDIHGNYYALQAVLDDVAGFAPDCYVFGGDIVSGAAQPRQCMEKLRRLNAKGTLGNMDEKVLEEDCAVTTWTKRQLQAEDIQILASLPLTQRICPPGGESPRDDLLIAHSTPRSCQNVLILNPPNPGPTRHGQPAADDEVREMLDGEEFDTMIYGHIHYTSERSFDGQRLMSVVAVGFPGDGDVRAGYALAEWENGCWKVVVRRVKYDHEEAAQFIETSGQPFERRYAAMVRLAKHLPKSAEWGYRN